MLSHDQNHLRKWRRIINLPQSLGLACQGQDNMETHRQILLRQCRICLVVHFLFLEASFKKFGYASKTKSFLGAVTYGAQDRYFWEISPAPKIKFPLGRRNLRRPRVNSSWWKIQSFWKMLKKIGNAQRNVFCTALSHNFMTVRWSPLYQSWLYIFFVIVEGWSVGNEYG